MIEYLIKYSSIFSMLIALFTIVIALFYRGQYNSSNAKRYQLLRQLIAILKSSFDNLKKKDYYMSQEEKMKYVIDTVEEIKNAFDKVTGCNCSVFLKMFVSEKDNVEIITMACDKNAYEKQGHFFINQRRKLSDDFAASLIYLGRSYFIDNDVSKSVQFNYGNLDNKNIQKRKLPFSSVLAVPIRHFTNESILGVLIIEGDKRNIFDMKLDIEITIEMANALSSIVTDFFN